MKILGIDYGRKKMGLAIGDFDSKLAEPVGVIRFELVEEVYKKIERIIRVEGINKIVMGVSEGRIAQEIKEFGKALEARFNIPITYQDETLTTHEAQELSIKAGIKRKRRHEMEDSYSAALILQAYIDDL